MFYVGADGCKGGWFAVGLQGETGWEINRFDDIKQLWKHYKDAKLILIDIPIGLRESGNSERICDKEARKLLRQPRGSSVFPVPCRPAVYASNYDASSRINKKLTGRRLSQQSLAMIPKIREVDEFLSTNKAARSRIREIHPEVSFWALNNRQPMKYSKKTSEGFEERKELLCRIYPHTDDLVNYALREYWRYEVAKDDILDALVAEVTASKEEQGLPAIPEKPEVDSDGLPMEMVYVTI